MKKTLFFMFCLLAFVACEAELDTIRTNQNITVNKTGTSDNIISADDAASMALEFRKSLMAEGGMTRSADYDRGVASVYAWRSSEVSPKAFTRSSIADVLPDTLLYIVNFEQNSGYALVSATTEMPGVVAYVEEGSLTPDTEIDNPGFLEFLEGYGNHYISFMDSLRYLPDTLREYDFVCDTLNPRLTDSLINIIPAFTLEEFKEPILETTWGQRWPYYNACPLSEDGRRTLAGCVAIAVSQIMTRHGFPDSYNGHDYLWNTIVRKGLIYPYETLAVNSIANLVHDIGLLVNMSYRTSISTASSDSVANALDSLGYHYEKLDIVAFDSIKSNIEAGFPIYISERISGEYYGHAWTIDGLAILRMTINQIILGNTITRWKYEKYVHCNWGWDGAYNGYYMMGAFEKQYNPSTGQTSTGPFSYNNDIIVYRNIYPLASPGQP